MYLVGAALFAVLDQRGMWLLGAAVQVLVLGLFVVFGVDSFDYEALSGLHIAAWAGAITGAEVVLLLGLLTYLARTAPRAPTGPPRRARAG